MRAKIKITKPLWNVKKFEDYTYLYNSSLLYAAYVSWYNQRFHRRDIIDVIGSS